MEERQKVLLIGADTGEDEEFETSMRELSGLAEACMLQVVGIITQKLETVNKAFYIGSGKVAEARAFAEDVGAEAAVFDNALSPSQMRNLQDELHMPVMDRTFLILDIFSRRARTREAKLQVETARLQYMLPRLVGMRESLSRQGGATGSLSSKGAGEKKLELDRRKIEHRITELKKELEEVSVEKEIQRKKRVRSDVPRVCMVGYTNAGKSTLMNGMVSEYIGDESKQVFEEDMLFATLETSVRLISRGDNRAFFLSDTVGFIHKLPHGLIQAFRSTLDEVREADLLVHVVDFSDENYKRHIKVTEETLRDMGAGDIPVIYVYNKVDLCSRKIPAGSENRIYMSAKSREGIAALTEMITRLLYAENSTEQYLVPYDQGRILACLREIGNVISQEYLENGVHLVVNCRQREHEKYRAYRISS